MCRFLAFFIGGYMSNLQTLIGMRSLQDGVDYYAEVHTSPFNSYIHTIGMPFTAYGILLWICNVFQLTMEEAKCFLCAVLIIYTVHYSYINTYIALLVMTYYSVPVYFVIRDLPTYNEPLNGLGTAVSALVFQEVIGHYLGGDPPSRLEAIPNAILYAPYYSISHLFN
jgi:uncharacterized membrane protein YGL010W